MFLEKPPTTGREYYFLDATWATSLKPFYWTPYLRRRYKKYLIKCILGQNLFLSVLRQNIEMIRTKKPRPVDK